MTPYVMIGKKRKGTCYVNSVSDPQWTNLRIEK